MYVNIGNYKNYIGPYQIVDAIFFWCEKYPEEVIENRIDYRIKNKLSSFLANGFSGDSGHDTWFHKLCIWIETKRKRKVKIRIDYYDTWSMDATLSPIILPMLKQLRATKHGSGFVELEDVPEHLRYTETEDYEPQFCFDFYKNSEDSKIDCDMHTRYNWVLDEMIWAFEQLCMEDWESQYWKQNPIMDLSKHPEDEGKSVIPVRWKVKGECDWEGLKKHQARIDNGLRLFGVYYQTLWD